MLYEIYRPKNIVEVKCPVEYANAILCAVKGIRQMHREIAGCLLIDEKYILQEVIVNGRGNEKHIDMSAIDESNTFSRALKIGTEYIITFHSHPVINGQDHAYPSSADIEWYKLNNKSFANEFNVPIIDSIIIAKYHGYSFNNGQFDYGIPEKYKNRFEFYTIKGEGYIRNNWGINDRFADETSCLYKFAPNAKVYKSFADEINPNYRKPAEMSISK